MRANMLTYSWRGTSGYSYGYVLITNHYSVEDIKKAKKSLVMWGGGIDNWGARCALEKAGLNVEAICDPKYQYDFRDIKTSYMTIKDYTAVLKNANEYFHIVNCSNWYDCIEMIKLLQYAGVREFGVLMNDYCKDFSGRKKLQDAVYDSIYEVFGEINILGNYEELANCSKAALTGTGYWDVPLMQIYGMFRKNKGTKYLEIGPGVGIMTLALKKLLDMDVTWINIPNEEVAWNEWRRDAVQKILKEYGVKNVEGYIELDDFSYMNNQFDVVVMAQVM